MGRRQRCEEEKVNADESERVCNRKQNRVWCGKGIAKDQNTCEVVQNRSISGIKKEMKNHCAAMIFS